MLNLCFSVPPNGVNRWCHSLLGIWISLRRLGAQFLWLQRLYGFLNDKLILKHLYFTVVSVSLEIHSQAKVSENLRLKMRMEMQNGPINVFGFRLKIWRNLRMGHKIHLGKKMPFAKFSLGLLIALTADQHVLGNSTEHSTAVYTTRYNSYIKKGHDFLLHCSKNKTE